VLQRVVIALLVLFLVATIVWLDPRRLPRRRRLADVPRRPSTTRPRPSPPPATATSRGLSGARLVNVLVITPLRVAFLIVLVGTTLEVLTQRTREQLRQNRWRSSLRDHTIVVGYGTKGRSAVRALLDDGADRDQIVVVDTETTTSPRRATTGSPRSTVTAPGSRCCAAPASSRRCG
jgi:voltage-gated potassium channel